MLSSLWERWCSLPWRRARSPFCVFLSLFLRRSVCSCLCRNSSLRRRRKENESLVLVRSEIKKQNKCEISWTIWSSQRRSWSLEVMWKIASFGNNFIVFKYCDIHLFSFVENPVVILSTIIAMWKWNWNYNNEAMMIHKFKVLCSTYKHTKQFVKYNTYIK